MIGRVMLRRANVDEILSLRHDILRAGLPISTARFEGDDENLTAHFGAFNNAILVGCASIMSRPWGYSPAWQLRGMAVRSNEQRSGVGRALLIAAEQHISATNLSRMWWCNARVPAARFYEKLGWIIASEVFDIPTAGPHVRMVKKL